MSGPELMEEVQELLQLRVSGKTTLRMQACIEMLKEEVRRLNGAIRVEQNLTSRIGTHGPDCYKWGPRHYECALIKIEELNKD